MTEITRRGSPPQDSLPPGRGPAPEVRRPAVATPVLSGSGVSTDPDVLRREIEETRARMTRTLDEIELKVARQKEQLVARATLRDLRHKVSREPWRTMAMAFLAGYVVAAIRD